ncbi:MAG: hypothetical protein KGZ57_09690 [Dethiobacter sp.]|nr:hypothetical protein [Dethiobacter sp.]MCL5982568.1 hypothetical protein [Bacillota bacterium]
MAFSGDQSICLTEPVQWAKDYLQDILETLGSSATGEHSLVLLSLEKEELRLVWHSLFVNRPENTPRHSRESGKPRKFHSSDGAVDGMSVHPERGPIFYAAGLPGARLFVLRQLLAAMPAAANSRHQSNEVVLSTVCSHLVELSFFLSGFAFPMTEKAPAEAVVEKALSILDGSNLLPRLTVAGQHLHLYCLDYRLPSPAYYLPFSHTLLCGASNLGEEEQLRFLLRQFGKVYYTLRTDRRKEGGDQALNGLAAKRHARHLAAKLLAWISRV